MSVERRVVSLPMRDGNFKHSFYVAHRVWVVSLPMRDGNLTISSRPLQQKRVVSLPMRDGNYSARQLMAHQL